MKHILIAVVIASTILALTLISAKTPAAARELLNAPTRDSAADVNAGSNIALTDAISRTPIIFIPGIMGSRLFNTANLNEHEIWADFGHIVHSNLDMLQLARDGVSPASNDPSYTTVHTKLGAAGAVANIQIFLYDYKVYQNLLDHFLQAPPAGLGYTEGVDFWVFPYDWRKDNRLAADQLDALVNQILTQTGQSQVYIVAHSMGGLVSRQYISVPAHAAKVKRLITLGTPYLGTPKALFVLLEGDCILDVVAMITPSLKDIICFPSMTEAQKIVVNYPGFYELFASRAYFDVKGGGYYGMSDTPNPTGACPQCLSYTQTYTVSVATQLNPTIMTSSDTFHQGIDDMGNWATPWNNVPVDIVAGIGQPTVVGVRQQTKWPCGCLLPSCVCDHVPIYSAQGDGTVALYSASMANPAIGTNLRGTASYTTFVGDHTGLTQMPVVWQYIEQRLGLTTTTTSLVAPLDTEDPSTFTNVQIVAFGATAMQAYNAAGQYTGPLSDTTLIRTSIPGSDYHYQEGLVSLVLRGGQVYTITVIPSGDSMVDLSLLQTSAGGAVTTTLHTSISATAQTRIHMLGDPFQANLWQIDLDGDGTIDTSPLPTLTYAPGAVRDTEPPTVTVNIEGALGLQGWYTAPVTVTLTAADNAAVSRVEYAFSGDTKPRLYTGPFVADPAQVSMMYAAVTDESGNMHRPIQVRLGPEKYYFPIMHASCRENCAGWAIGSDETNTAGIVHTADGGQTWQAQGNSAAWTGFIGNDISAVDAQTAWAAVGSETQGAILHTTNGGATWVSQTLPAGVAGGIKGIKGLSRTEAWAASLGGTILRTTNGGVTWSIVPHPTVPITQVNRIDALSGNVWIADEGLPGVGNPFVIHTQDNGLTWRQEFLPEVTPNHGVHGIAAYSPMVVWSVAWAQGDFYRTMDGGANWLKAAPGVSGEDDFDDLCAASAETVWGVLNLSGWAGSIYRVNVAADGTVNTQTFDPVSGNIIYEGMTCLNDSVAWVVGYQAIGEQLGLILHTVDGGEHWTQQTAPTNINYWKISFVGARR